MVKSKKQLDFIHSKENLDRLRRVGLQKGHKICVGRVCSNDTKNKIRNSPYHKKLAGKNNPNYGKKYPLWLREMEENNPAKRIDVRKKISLYRERRRE